MSLEIPILDYMSDYERCRGFNHTILFAVPLAITGQTKMVMKASEVVREVIRRGWNQGDLDVLDERVGENYVRHMPDGELSGIQAFKDRMVEVRQAFPDFNCQVLEVVEEANGRGVARWEAHATQQGETNGIPPTGRAVKWPGMVWFVVRDGKIVEEWEIYDRLGVIQSLTDS